MTDVRIISGALGGSALSRLLQRGEAPAEWLASTVTSPSGWRSRAQQRSRERRWDECWTQLAPALDATGAAAERLEKVRREGGVVITTGQQAGLFGGPVYTWSKAMGALAFADAIQRETGVATAVVFWAATDDADFAEASYTVLARQGGPEKLQSQNAPTAGVPMALAPLGDVGSLLARLRDACGSVADPRALRAVESAYSVPSATVGSAYVSLLRTLLEPLGIPVLDASHENVRAASDATLREALGRADDIERALVSRSLEIKAAGFAPQVEHVGGLSLVFARENSIKSRIPLGEASRFAGDENAWLTPNVLLRPIVEQAILPTIAYFGGPGELAYFAQVSAVANALDVETPVAVPRWSCTLIEPDVDRLLAKFAISPNDLAQPDRLEGIVARETMSDRTKAALAALRASVEALPEALRLEAEPLGLGAAVEGSMRSLLHRADRLERRLVAGVKRREHARLLDVATLRGALYPLNVRQERALNLVPLLSRHGLDLLGEMREVAAAHAAALMGISST
ncbi:MAG: bacillithiol biosynthesis BshC [Gemmatimonadota bacterium]|nr:bacillithiol biosynthesis BshC [Gemmatimonadota bacterium]